MSEDDDIWTMDDQAFLTVRKRVREELERTPEAKVSPELAVRYQKLNEEFLRRARVAWTRAAEGG
ncbi:MAG: hypothetical protein ACRDOI_32590 [Trebonia sp.]